MPLCACTSLYEIGQIIRSQFALQAVCDTRVIDPSMHVVKRVTKACIGLDAGRCLEQDRLAARIPCHVACRYDQRMRTERQRIERNGCSLLHVCCSPYVLQRDRRLAAVNPGQVIAKRNDRRNIHGIAVRAVHQTDTVIVGAVASRLKPIVFAASALPALSVER